MGQLVHALVDRKHAADAEQQDRHQERPEVQRAAPAQRKLVRGRALGLADAQQQQPLVAAVGQRMHRLGQHRAGAGDEGGHQLGQEDGEVGAQGEKEWP